MILDTRLVERKCRPYDYNLSLFSSRGAFFNQYFGALETKRGSMWSAADLASLLLLFHVTGRKLEMVAKSPRVLLE